MGCWKKQGRLPAIAIEREIVRCCDRMQRQPGALGEKIENGEGAEENTEHKIEAHWQVGTDWRQYIFVFWRSKEWSGTIR